MPGRPAYLGGGAMVLGKLPAPGRPTIWITVGQGPTVLAVGAGGGCLDIFTLIYPFFPLSSSLWETARYRLKYCLKGPLNPKQPTNQPAYLDKSRARAFCACSRCGWGLFGHFFSRLSFLLSFSLSLGEGGGAMVLGKLPVPGRPTIWITVGQGPTALAVGAGCLDIFTLIYPFSPLSPLFGRRPDID